MDILEELQNKCIDYNIPYSIEESDKVLSDKIENWEELLQEAREQGIEWDETYYEPDELLDAVHYKTINELNSNVDLKHEIQQKLGVVYD